MAEAMLPSSILLPVNATKLERNLVDTTDRMSKVPVPLDTLWNPDTCPDVLLPWLAWAMSVDEWDETWSITDKRAVIKNSINVHRRKGTIGALKDALAALKMDLEVIEWFQEIPPADAYTFAVNVYLNSRTMALEDQLKIFKIVSAYKNARSQLSFLHIHQNLVEPVPVLCAVVSTSQHITISEGI
ncbi:MAG: phage tail protein I [Gammaproteobacteria bacterium]|nr:phage tail protein I [Gammaproteobacteria bacterium]MDH5651685.1 phage tail protein I [Gammaproteobacteria bacterium]